MLSSPTPRRGFAPALVVAAATLLFGSAALADKNSAPLPGQRKGGVPALPVDPKTLPKPKPEEINEARSILLNAHLLVACERGDAARVRKLLGEGVDPNAKRTSGATALSYAVAGKHREVVKILLDAKADPNRVSFGLSPLFLASENGDTDTVKLLLSAGANPNYRLEAVDEDMKVRNGDTPLIAAASPNGKASVVKALLGAGANVNAKADNGKTAVLQAIASENPGVLKALLEAKPDLTARMEGEESFDALTLAVGNRKADMVSALLAAGANARVKIDGEVTLLEFAILSEQPEVAAMLRKAGVEEPSRERLAALRQAAAE